MSEDIRIYIADLAAYNNGILHGIWVDATDDIDDIWRAVSAMLKNSPVPDSEEHAIHDYEGFGSYRISECDGLESVHEIACFIEEHGNLGAELLNYFSDMDEAKQAMEERYGGHFKSLADYAQGFTEETSEISEHLQFYIDYDKMGRDWEMSGDIFTIETGYEEIHVFYAV